MPAQYGKILVVQPDLIGDVILTSPFLRELKKRFPESCVSLVVHPDTYNLVELCPYVNNIFKYNCHRSWFGQNWKYAWQALKLYITDLCKHDFDLAIFPHWDTDNYGGTFICALSGASKRIGFSEHCNTNKAKLNKGFDNVFTDAVITKTVRHEAEQKLFLLKSLGAENPSTELELWLSDDDSEFASSSLANRDRSKKLAAICLGASLPRKIWSIKNYAELLPALKEKNFELLFIGSQEEKSLSENFADLSNFDFTGKTTLRQAAALIKHCDIYFGNDTGPMHMAAAQDVPCVVISCHSPLSSDVKPISPARFGPWQVPSRIMRPSTEKPMRTAAQTQEWHASYCDFCPRQYCTCIEQITVPEAMDAIESII